MEHLRGRPGGGCASVGVRTGVDQYLHNIRVALENGAGADPDAGTPSARAAAQMFERQDILALLG